MIEKEKNLLFNEIESQRPGVSQEKNRIQAGET
jgi:hypothetical protein